MLKPEKLEHSHEVVMIERMRGSRGESNVPMRLIPRWAAFPADGRLS